MPSGVRVLGLAEQSGVLVDDGVITAVGASATAVVSDGGRELPVGATLS